MGMLLRYIAVVLFFMVAGECLHASGPEIKANDSSIRRQTDSVNISSAIPDIPVVHLSLKDVYVPEVQMDMQDHSHFVASGLRSLYAGSYRKSGGEQAVCSGKFRDYLAVRHLHGFYILFLKKLII